MPHAVDDTFRRRSRLRNLLRLPKQDARDRVILVEGHRGSGKSTYLDDALVLAEELGLPTAGHRSPSPVAAARTGVLITVDDVMTVAGSVALRSAMAAHDAAVDHPVLWVISTDGSTGDDLRELLDRVDEVESVVLHPWDHKAVLELASRLLGESPSDGLVDLLRGAGGNPMLVSALVRGLTEEGRTAVPMGDRSAPPQRVQEVVRAWLSSMSEPARQLVQVCSVLGRSFTAAQASSMVGVPTGGLLSAFDEVIRAGILGGDSERLRFRHDLVRQVVAEDLPVWARTSLQRDAVDMGGPRLAAAAPDSTTRLVPAVLLAKTTLPAPLSLHAHDELFRMLVDELAAARAPVAQPEQEAERISSLIHHDPQQALERCRRIANAPDRQANRPHVIVALTVLSNLEWSAGSLDEALRAGAHAASLSDRLPVPAWRPYPRLTLASKLADLGRYDDAAGLLAEAAGAVRAIGHPECAVAAASGVVTARILMQRGKLDEARQEIDEALRIAALPGNQWVVPFARAVLALISFRKGDVEAAAEAIWRSNAERSAHTTVFPSLRLAWGEFLVANEKLGHRRAKDLLTTRHLNLLEQRSLFLEEPGAAALLVRSALAADDVALAYSITADMRGFAESNAGHRALWIAASHVAGLVDGDLSALRKASHGHLDPWARALATEDFGLALARAGSEPDQAFLVLRTALDQFERIGAKIDADRVRTALRPQRVSRARGSSAEPAALTETQRSIVLLATEGLTNQQIAHRLSMTTHTVKYHLGNIFTKLGVSSRVELARHAGAVADG
jgi:DNA-binding CsgD family transcriptional regulator